MRQRAAAAVVGDQMVIFGGLDNFTAILNDTWRFNLTANRWRQMDVSVRHTPGPRTVHVRQWWGWGCGGRKPLGIRRRSCRVGPHPLTWPVCACL